MSSTRPSVLVLGYGEIGSAIAHMLSTNTRIAVTAWDKNASKIPNQPPLESIVPGADVIVVCVPTWVLGNALQSIGALIKPGTILVTLTKGFEKESCRTVPDVVAQTLPAATHVHLAGPMLAEELHAGSIATAVAASTNAAARKKVVSLFRGTALRVVPSADIVGVAIAGALKNVYAIGMGAIDELALGANARGWYTVRAVDEMRAVVEAFGGKKQSAFGIAGLGDLVATGTSTASGNYTVGRELARGAAPSKPSEGMHVLPCIFKRLPDLAATLPLLQAINIIVNEKGHPKDCLTRAFLA